MVFTNPPVGPCIHSKGMLLIYVSIIIGYYGDKLQFSMMFTIVKQGSMYCKVTPYLKFKSLTQQAPFH